MSNVFARSIAASVLFAGLILGGYGRSDFFEDLPRALFFFTGIVAVFWVARGRKLMRRGTDQGESTLLFFILIFMTAGLAFLIPFLNARRITFVPAGDVWRYTGVILFLIGLFLRNVAVRTLKRQFSIYVTIQENHQLITTGIYSHVRHPIYLGAILSLAGFALVFPTLLGFLFVIIYFILLARRMAHEEMLLLKHFGSVYEEYISKSYRLIPHIY